MTLLYIAAVYLLIGLVINLATDQRDDFFFWMYAWPVWVFVLILDAFYTPRK